MRYPPSRTAPAHAAISEYARDRMEDYLDLRRLGESREAAAQRLRVTLRTAYRYEARHRAGGTLSVERSTISAGITAAADSGF